MLKVSENPPVVWPEGKSIRDFTGQWWIAHTRSRNEKALAHDLVSKGISYFLPMRWNVRYHKGRKIRSLLPLFTSYVFFCSDETGRVESLKTNRVASLIQVTDQQKLVKELSQIECALLAGVDLAPHKYIKTGQRCQVTAGPLAHLKGIVVQIKGVSRLILQVDMLGQAASVEIDTDLIEVLDEAT